MDCLAPTEGADEGASDRSQAPEAPHRPSREAGGIEAPGAEQSTKAESAEQAAGDPVASAEPPPTAAKAQASAGNTEGREADGEELGIKDELVRVEAELRLARSQAEESTAAARDAEERLAVVDREKSGLEGRVATLEAYVKEANLREERAKESGEALAVRVGKLTDQLAAARESTAAARSAHDSELAASQERLRGLEVRLGAAGASEAGWRERVRRLEASQREMAAKEAVAEREWHERAGAYVRDIEQVRAANKGLEEEVGRWKRRCGELDDALQKAVMEAEGEDEGDVGARRGPASQGMLIEAPTVAHEVPEGLLVGREGPREAKSAEELGRRGAYEAYVEAVAAWNREHRLRGDTLECLMEMVDRLNGSGEKITVMEDRLHVAVATISRQQNALVGMAHEKEGLLESIEGLTSDLAAEQNKTEIHAQAVEDLSVQVRTMLEEMQQMKVGKLQGFGAAGLASSPALNLSKVSDRRQDPISAHLVAVRDIEDMQRQNQQLRDALRAVALEAEHNHARSVASYKEKCDERVKASESEIELLRKELEVKSDMVEHLTHQRDAYQKLVVDGAQHASAHSADSGQPMDEQRKQIEGLKQVVSQLESELVKAKDVHAVLSVTKEQLSQADNQLTTAQGDLAKLQAQCDVQASRISWLVAEAQRGQKERDLDKEEAVRQRRLASQWLEQVETLKNLAEEADEREHRLAEKVDSLEDVVRTMSENAEGAEEAFTAKVNAKDAELRSLEENHAKVVEAKDSELAEVRGLLEESERRIERMQIDVEGFEEQTQHVLELQGEIVVLKSELESMKASAATAQEMQGTAAEVETLRSALSESKKSEEQAKEQCTSLLEEMAKLKADTEVETLREALSESRRCAEEAENRCSTLLEELKTAGEAAEKLAAEEAKALREAEERCASVTQRYEALMQTLRQEDEPPSGGSLPPSAADEGADGASIPLDKQKEQAVRRMVALEAELNEKTAKLEHAEKELNEKTCRLKQAEKELVEKTDGLQLAEKKVEEKTTGLEQANKDLNEKSRILEQAEKELEDKTGSFVQAKQQVSEVTGRLEVANKELQENASRMEVMQTELNEKTNKLTLAEAQASETAGRLQLAEKEIAALKGRLQVQTEKDEQTARIKEKHQQAMEDLKLLPGLSAQVAGLQRRQELTKKSSLAMQAQKDEIERKKVMLEGTVRNLQEDLAAKDNDLIAIKAQLQEKEAKLKSLESLHTELDMLRRRVSTLAGVKPQDAPTPSTSKVSANESRSSRLQAARRARRASDGQKLGVENGAGKAKSPSALHGSFQTSAGQEDLAKKMREIAALKAAMKAKEEDMKQLRGSVRDVASLAGVKKNSDREPPTRGPSGALKRSLSGEETTLGKRLSNSSLMRQAADRSRKVALGRVRLPGTAKVQRTGLPLVQSDAAEATQDWPKQGELPQKLGLNLGDKQPGSAAVSEARSVSREPGELWDERESSDEVKLVDVRHTSQRDGRPGSSVTGKEPVGSVMGTPAAKGRSAALPPDTGELEGMDKLGEDDQDGDAQRGGRHDKIVWQPGQSKKGAGQESPSPARARNPGGKN
ncbi:unnamed protein product [Ostreobium quekettii]|uniref:NUA/TPR/MLP1-2-like domain-containing protein n=1 Tax=Ostreobium quekettii TaxID=121088 RepID=A0A8S1J6C6_9CHLO|nr:unnamed protein product [Ostreobium quekettii]|eukprot:evm.model.scf_1213.3 EVM.evm.TU.scf_1213.3   scf_1213:19397-24755(-)